MAEKRARALDLFLTFLKFGLFTFGGGWSIVAQIQKEYVEKRRLITNEDLLDFTSVGRSLPGIMIGNISVLFGYKVAGALGAIAAIAGITIPPFIVMVGVTQIYNLVRDNIYVARAMSGVTAAVVPIILCAMLKLTKSAIRDKFCLLIALAAAGLSILTGMSSILIVLSGAAAGILASEVKARRGLR